MEISVGVQSGYVTFSFKTNENGSNLEEGFGAISRLVSSHSTLLNKVNQSMSITAPLHTFAQTTPQPMAPGKLALSKDQKDAILSQIDSLNLFEIFILLLHYATGSLTYNQIMAASRDLGKPIRYNWLDSEPHRKKHVGIVKSEPIPGKKEKLYSLSERGKKLANQLIDKIKSNASSD